ncbi:ATP-binding protein [Flavobacterium sp.]|uniref:ATP-binding protein n=1 Tax=Flavobacterium sp. TaxID=239 RepID=UPI0026327214|nr:ATP-binding protein [Flavobacterium sp.]
MKLKSLSYKDSNWELENLQLGIVNLVVGKNSTGKTKTLQTIDLLVKMITQKRDLNWGGDWQVIFENHKGDEIEYRFSTSFANHGVTFEKMTVNGELVLARNRKNYGNRVKIKNLNNKGLFDYTYPPENKLVIHTNRDIKKYPYLEDIANWAEQSYGFKFGNISPYSLLNRQEYDLLTAVEDIPTLFKSLKKTDKEQIISDFNNIGYKLTDITIQDKTELTIIFVKEDGISKSIPHFKLSQGMFRALAVIVYVQYLLSRKRPATIIIDDLCEGLDYERATNLGKLIFSKCLNNDIQLIATSNDSFLMEVVDLKYWNILMREGTKVKSINSKSDAEAFENFKFTGLSNFDFFSSNYLMSKNA